MPLSDLIPSEPFPFIPRIFAAALGAVICHAGISAYTQPVRFTRTYGLPQKEPVNPWVYAFAARELTMGIVLCTFAARKDWNSVGLVGLVTIICGVTDGVLIGNFGDGWKSAWKGHFIPTIVFAPVSWYLLMS